MGRILVGAGRALTTIDARGTAVGFSDCNEKEGVAVGVGRRVVVLATPETGTPEEGEIEEEEEDDEEEDADATEEACDAART